MNISSSYLLKISVSLLIAIALFQTAAQAQNKRTPALVRTAVVVDERLAVLRKTPGLSGESIRRLGRGRKVSIEREVRNRTGLVFARIRVTRRTSGWIMRDAVVVPRQKADETKLLRLIHSSADFDLIARARIFLDLYPHSSARPEVLLLMGDAASAAAAKLSRDAGRRLQSLDVNGPPQFAYYLNYSGLDRYRRQGVEFKFDPAARSLRYDGAHWQEIVRWYPHSPEAAVAKTRLEAETGNF